MNIPNTDIKNIQVHILKLYLVLVCLCFAQLVKANNHPNMYLNQEEIDAIKVKSTNNIEPWSSAYDVVISKANAALNQTPLSVTYGQGRTGNQYYSEKPYCGWPSPPAPSNGCIDGQVNPNADRQDYESAILLGDTVRDLGLGYAFTKNSSYADKAIELIWYWSLNPATYMKPNTAIENRIELFITMPGLLYGADLIWNYSGWETTEKTNFTAWALALGNQTRNSGVGPNNFANWRLVLIASVGAYVNNINLLNFVESEWQRLLPLQMKDAGSIVAGQLGEEAGRTKGLHYSLYAINAMIQGAEIMRHRNINLYDVTNEGRSLELALDYISPYAINPNSWPYQQITTITQNDSMALFELAYSYYQKPLYLNVINRWGRPMDEIRIMGINTLTHGNYFELNFTPIPPTVITQPSSQSILEATPVTFNIVATGSATLNFQWYRNNKLISGATNSSYTIESVSISDNGTQFYCLVSNSLGSDVSDNAVLTVVSDTQSPTIENAVVQSKNLIDIVFSEAVTVASSQNINNYQISSGIQVMSANINSDGKTVQLQTDNLTANNFYTVTLNNIKDVSAAANEIAPNSSIDIQFSAILNFDNGMLPLGWIPLNLSRWSIVAENGNNVLFLNTTDYQSLSGNRLGEYILSPDSYSDFTLSVRAKTNEPSSNNNADYALVFGFQDENNYYYMLFNRIQLNTALFRVIGGNRQELRTSTGQIADELYHTIEVRRVSDAVEIIFDNNTILQTSDSTFSMGQVGLGSFNDSSYFDDIRITTSSTSIINVIFSSGFEQ